MVIIEIISFIIVVGMNYELNGILFDVCLFQVDDSKDVCLCYYKVEEVFVIVFVSSMEVGEVILLNMIILKLFYVKSSIDKLFFFKCVGVKGMVLCIVQDKN